MRRSTFIALGLFTLVECLFAWGLWRAFQSESEQALSLSRTELEVNYRHVVQSKADLVDAMLVQAVDVPAVRSLMTEAAGLDAEGQRRSRGRLYRLLERSFRILEGHDIRGLQLLLPDGTSFLRFNQPDLFGDSIADQRPLIARVIATHEPHRAFENTRVYPGFHYVYPLIEAGKLVGMVDFGLSFDAIRKALQESALESGTRSQFLLRRDLLESVAHPSTRDRFRPAALHPELVVEVAHSIAGDGEVTPSSPDWLPAVDQVLAAEPAARAALQQGRPYGTHVCPGHVGCYVATLMPVPDSLGRPGAMVAAYSADPGYKQRSDRSLLVFGLGTLLILAAGFASRHWLVSSRRLQTISESMAEGLYVIDRQGRMLFANPAAIDLLGYSREELLGSDAHRTFHVDCQGGSLLSDQCDIRRSTEQGAVYRGDNQSFRCRDGNLIRVSVVSSPLREDGGISGSIVLFRDVTGELETRERLKRADVAFRNLAEGIVVTDSNTRIIAVNPAFSQITGYSEPEVLGRNPRFLSSGRHDAIFYAEMWRVVRDTGAWEGEIWNRRKGGEAYPEWLKITAIPGESGEPLGYVAVFADIADLRAKEERLRSLAYQDQLTGLYNRASFIDLLEHALIRCRSRGSPLALLSLGLDRFKRINDTLGHLAGDSMLQEMARRVRAGLRPQDEAARLGGDELAVLLEDLDHRATLAHTAHEILTRVREPVMLHGRPIYLTASIGISVFPQDGEDASTLLKNADAAMYLAKQQGRDGYRYFSVAMAREAEQRFELESELRQALELGQLRLFYQPQVDLASGFVIALEALLRWEHPRGGTLEPSTFLSVARDAGLMPQITEWTMREACRQCAQWRHVGVPFGRLAFNLDVLCIAPGALESLLLSVVRDAGVGPRDLELEILETAMHPREAEKGLWERLVTLGFELAIDDFGTGESSLARLQRLPVRTLKIDREFLSDIEHQGSDRSIVRTVIAMTKLLGKRALAEGVETEAQLRFLLDAGCDAVQGYFFSRPLPAERIPDLLSSGRLRRRLLEVKSSRIDADTLIDHR